MLAENGTRLIVAYQQANVLKNFELSIMDALDLSLGEKGSVSDHGFIPYRYGLPLNAGMFTSNFEANEFIYTYPIAVLIC